MWSMSLEALPLRFQQQGKSNQEESKSIQKKYRPLLPLCFQKPRLCSIGSSPSRIAHLRMNIQRIPPLRKTRFQRRIYPLLPPSQPLSTQHNRPPHYGHGIRGIQSRALPTTTFTVTHVTLTRLPAMANSSSGKTTDSSTTWDRLPHQRLRTRPPFPRPSTSP